MLRFSLKQLRILGQKVKFFANTSPPFGIILIDERS